MTIKWLGHACFSITHNGYTVVIDPYNSREVPGYPPLHCKADRLLVSHEHYGHNCREAVTLSGRSEAECPFTITAMEVAHDTSGGTRRGKCLVHILEADGLKAAHMGDIGTQLVGSEITKLFGADAIMITAGSCTSLPSQEVWRLTEGLFPKAIIPMHYRDGERGSRRLEHITELINYFEAPEMIHRYDTDTIEITPDTEPQLAVLKYMGR